MQPVKSRREENSEATRTALLDAATRLFAERGFAGTALDDVAAATRMTRGAVYHHFEGKRALFEAVLDALEERSVQQIGTAAANTDNAWDAALVGLDAFLDQCCDPLYGRLVMLEGPVALGWNVWNDLEQKYAYGLTEAFVRGLVEDGYVAPSPVETTTRLVFGMLSGAAHAIAEAGDERKQQVRDEFATIIRRILDGIRLQPARDTQPS